MALKIGARAPDFKLRNERGEQIKLSSFKGKRVILYFYPKDDTPGCTKQACGFRDNYATIQNADALVLGISPDSVESHAKFIKKYSLPFTLLSDSDHVVAEKYGAWGEKSMYGKKYMGIIRSHIVIDENGKIADIQIGVKPEDSVKSAVNHLTQ